MSVSPSNRGTMTAWKCLGFVPLNFRSLPEESKSVVIFFPLVMPSIRRGCSS